MMMDYTNPNDPYWNDSEQYKGMNDDERIAAGICNAVIMIISFIAAIALCGMCSSCTTTEYITVEKVRTDTTYITKHQRDSIYLKDSTNVHEWSSGDTMYIEVLKCRTEYRERKVHDTIYQSKVDSIPQPYPVEVKVPRELTWWQRLRINIGGIAIGLLAITVIAGIFRLKKRLLK